MITAHTDKHLFGRFERKRNAALRNPSIVPTGGRYGLDDLGVIGGAGGIDNKDAFIINNNPADKERGLRKIDIRKDYPARD